MVLQQYSQYEAVITELELALQIPVTNLTTYGDSELVVKQLREEYGIKKKKRRADPLS